MKKSLSGPFQANRSDGTKPGIGIERKNKPTVKCKYVYNGQNFYLILEDFYNLFIYKKFEGKDKIEVTNWQPCLFLRFAVSCYQCHSS